MWSRRPRALLSRRRRTRERRRPLDQPLVLGARKTLFDVSAFEPGYFHDFDVSADGERFLFIRAEPGARPTRIEVVVNWFPELAARAGK